MADDQRVNSQVDRTIWYSDLAYMSEEYKRLNMWMAQAIYYAKRNSSIVLDPEKARQYRALDRMDIDENELKRIIDPPTPMDKGGNPEFFSADWKSFPIDFHLDNIIRASLEKIPAQLTIKLADPIAKTLEQKEKEKIIYQREFRRIINEMNKELGLPPIKDTQDPYKFAESLRLSDMKGGVPKEGLDSIGDPADMIRNRIKNDDQFRLYMKYIYKNGIEIALESAINYYLVYENKWRVKQQDFINDLKNFNLCTGMWYVDTLTGRGVIKYLRPETVYTSPFYEKNGEDILYWGHEDLVNFAEFERMFGSTLTPTQKKDILDLNKLWGANGASTVNTIANVEQQWESGRRTNAMLRIGYFSILTQESEEYSSEYEDKLMAQPKGTQIMVWDKNGPSNMNEGTKECKTYNVWYRCYYVPMPAFQNGTWPNGLRENWSWLSRYIFDVRKETDMYRYGVDQRYAKSALVIWRDLSRPSHTDIKQRFMPKINLLWQKIQNALVQDIEGMAFDYDLLGALLSTIDDANKDNNKGGDALISEMKSLRQSGLAWMKFRDKNGNLIIQDPNKLFVKVQSGHLEKAEKMMLIILMLYNQMTQALAASEASQGVQPDPRTPAKGIEIAAQATLNARWYLEMPVMECLIMFGERCVQHVFNIIKEKKTYGYQKRWDEMQSVIGFANMATLESISDIPIENVGLSVVAENNTERHQIVKQMAIQKAAAKEISTQDLALIMDIDNWKYAMMEMVFAEERQAELIQMAEAQKHQQAMELKQMDLKIAMTLQGQKIQGDMQGIDLQGRIDQMLQQQMIDGKTQSQALLKEQLSQLRMLQDANKSVLTQQEDSNRASLENQSA